MLTVRGTGAGAVPVFAGAGVISPARMPQGRGEGEPISARHAGIRLVLRREIGFVFLSAQMMLKLCR
jgi:hypothetical protein